MGQPALESETLQRRRDILSTKALSDLDRQAFAGKQVYDGERPETPAVGQLVRPGTNVFVPTFWTR